MQYTVDVAKKGTYTISFTVSAGTDSSKLSLSSDNQLLIKELAIPNTGGEEKWKVIEAKNIHLKKGTNKLKLYADKGGFTIFVIHFTKQ